MPPAGRLAQALGERAEKGGKVDTHRVRWIWEFIASFQPELLPMWASLDLKPLPPPQPLTPEEAAQFDPSPEEKAEHDRTIALIEKHGESGLRECRWCGRALDPDEAGSRLDCDDAHKRAYNRWVSAGKPGSDPLVPPATMQGLAKLKLTND